ncbi:hypothetical protein [Micromonospora sp. SL4-19]|uniref:hypothetical protein n=1 Tax=Micromonospora sp. SL4-19 TaxID=3399129 RepID=UPI003A4DEA2E
MLNHLPGAVREADWITRLVSGFLVCLAVTSALGWWFTLPDAWDSVRAVAGGVTGSAAVTCEESATKWGRGWTCTGPFTSSTGDVYIDRVQLFMRSDQPPGPTVTGRVSRPEATWMWPDGEIGWLPAVALAVGLPILAGYLFHLAVEAIEPLGRQPNPKQKPREGPPEMGNRARHRRRRRK